MQEVLKNKFIFYLYICAKCQIINKLREWKKDTQQKKNLFIYLCQLISAKCATTTTKTQNDKIMALSFGRNKALGAT